MSSKVVNQRIAAQRPPSAEDLRVVFETAVCELREANFTSRPLKYHSPMVQRRRISRISQAEEEKRALSDAARALAELWKI
jgi:hypothetical protein